MIALLGRLNPFKTADARRLALLFGVVYFAQGMWYLPNQSITVVLKDRGLSAGQVADFFLITMTPWLIKPLYGLLSDFVPLFGRRRQSYFLLTCGLAATAGLLLVWSNPTATGDIQTITIFGVSQFTLVAGVGLFTVMAFGLAFTDVLTDALMVENGRPRGLTGAFQSVQWASITLSTVAVGELGGYLAESRNLRLAFFLAACFPIISQFMVLTVVREPVTRFDKAGVVETWRAIRSALGAREIWLVAGFIFFFWFSPSFGPAFLYYQTDILKFSQQYIGRLAAVGALSGVVGAFVYAPLSRRLPLKRVINLVIGFGVAATLAYLLYRDAVSAMIITIAFGGISMIMQLAFLDLAAKACPRGVEATFFALLMSVFNLGVQLAENVGARLYDRLGYAPLVYIGAAMTALTWLLVPLIRIDRIEANARAAAAAPAEGAAAP